MPGSLRIGRIFGITVEINFSWLIIFVLLSVSLALGWYPQVYGVRFSSGTYWLLGAVSAVLLFVSVLIHELAHSIVARARGIPVKSITLFVFGGVSNIEQEPKSAGMEFQIAIVGPVSSLIIGAISWLVAVRVGSLSLPVAAVLGYLGISNVLLGLFNLIPGFPLDGGRVLRSILWRTTGNPRTATRWASRVGQLAGYLFILWGIWQLFGGNVLGGVWIGFIGWFLISAAQTADTQAMLQGLLRGVTVADVMNPVALTAPPTITLQHLADAYLLPHGLRAICIVQEERLVGLVTLHQLRDVPRERWPYELAGDAMIPVARLHTVTPEQDLNTVFAIMAQRDINQLPVVRDSRLVGMLSRDAVVRFLEVRRELGPVEAERVLQEQREEQRKLA
jgi:Zn-dependent protease/CBS domain-containing protein